jgi:hypothetical protein
MRLTWRHADATILCLPLHTIRRLIRPSQSWHSVAQTRQKLGYLRLIEDVIPSVFVRLQARAQHGEEERPDVHRRLYSSHVICNACCTSSGTMFSNSSQNHRSLCSKLSDMLKPFWSMQPTMSCRL